MAQRKYPHLLSVDVPVWERFLDNQGDTYDHFEYDVRVGEGRDPGDEYDANLRKMGIDLSQRRIDAIGYRPNRIDIIEITRIAGLRALGQLMAYPKLYQIRFPDPRPVHPLLVCEEFDTDMQHPFTAHGIPVVILPAP